jgi:hypothetical protein
MLKNRERVLRWCKREDNIRKNLRKIILAYEDMDCIRGTVDCVLL